MLDLGSQLVIVLHPVTTFHAFMGMFSLEDALVYMGVHCASWSENMRQWSQAWPLDVKILPGEVGAVTCLSLMELL